MTYSVTTAFVAKSKNKKVGKIPVVTSESKTCPSACPLKNNGCYAQYGPMSLKWRALEGLSKMKVTTKTWDEMCNSIESLPAKQLWRMNDGGDLPGNNNDINTLLLEKLVKANKGKCGWTYTHKPVGLAGQKLFEENRKKYRFSYKTALTNARAIRAANLNGFTVNLSGDSLEEADELYDLNIGPVVVTVPSDSPTQQKTPRGRHVIVCPAQHADIACKECGLCAKQRKAIVGFWAHGAGTKKINKRLNVIQG